MSKQCLLFFSFILMLLSGACKKKDDPKGITDYEYFIFGTYSGQCSGDCVTYYKLENGQIYRDNILAGTASLSFYSTPLSADDFSKAQRVTENFPTEMMRIPDRNYGCPDCKGQGGYLVQLRKGGQTMNWKLDTNNSANAEEVREFVNAIQTTINALN